MDKRYNHLQFEKKIYQLWEKNNCFNPDYSKKKQGDSATTKKNKKTFTIIMPPPNANDPLHIGHAMFVSLEDIMIRYHRMLGEDTLWLPGTDHAGIETQFVFEKKLKKQGKSRFQYDRETLYQKIWDYVQENSDVAVDQIKKLGASADWSRFKFTLDEDVVDSVLDSFEKLKKGKLIYRSNNLVNYCTNCGTAFSNLEVKQQEQQSPLYYLKYGPLTVATTRPETKFADIALAVNPQDKRYQKYVGQEIKINCLADEKEALQNDQVLKLKVIADEFVDPEFGTGVVKITPFHDFNDFEFWTKYQKQLPKPATAIDFNGRLTALAGKYAGLKVHIAREQIVKDLKEKKLLIKVNEKYQNKVGTCYRCGKAIEPLPLPQFYIKVKPLVKAVLKAIAQGELEVLGAGHDKILRHWLEILDDWNISRQIVWGIRMPVWYDISENSNIQISFIDKNGQKVSGTIGDLLKERTTSTTTKSSQVNLKNSKKTISSNKQGYSLTEINAGLQELMAPITAAYKISKKSPGKNYIQETDTFDTWFSSSQWPFVTLKNTQAGDFERFYPTQVMETAYDILMFWVMRMLMMGKFITGKLPFNQVYLHGLIRDAKGQKMSKSKGNVVNPLEISEKYSADALRMALVIRSSPGLDKAVGMPDFKAARNLNNKLWNASRFVLLILENKQEAAKKNEKQEEAFDKKLKKLIIQINQQLKKQKIGLAAETLYNEFWHWYCDQVIEECKKGQISQAALLKGLITFLKLFHPFLPFITEAIWQELKKKKLVNEKFLIRASWPGV
ncbi:MAG: valine--tRNA ligase [Candidatus Woesebacteria bacterium]|jgi:valyl-tRNA synthetase